MLPAVRVRHWICSLPWGLRALLGYDRELCAEVVSAFVGELSRSLKKKAKRELGLASGRSLEREGNEPEPQLSFDESRGLVACYAAATEGMSVSGERAGLPNAEASTSTPISRSMGVTGDSSSGSAAT